MTHAQAQQQRPELLEHLAQLRELVARRKRFRRRWRMHNSSSSWSADSLTSWWRIRPAVGSVTAWSCRYLGLLLLLFSVLVYLTGSILAAVNSKHLTNINNK